MDELKAEVNANARAGSQLSPTKAAAAGAGYEEFRGKNLEIPLFELEQRVERIE